jgi:capsular exopolysaccharide synthesis family protein
MSRIFKALQWSEAERSGAESLPLVESVADLLQTAERETPSETDAAELFSAAAVLHPAPAVDARLVCLTDQGSLGAEKFRVLGLRLRHLREKRKLRRIVVTSAIPEEGKSVISANLALIQARSKILKTLLLDGDLRRPALASCFGFHRNLPGLSECLRGERRLADVVYKLNPSGLWFLPAGQAPQNPMELMQSGRLSEILEQLGTFFDWIIIDAPPVLPLADTPLWMKLADGVLIVTREGVSEKKVLGRAVEAVDRSNVIGVVVNSCSGSGQKYYYSRYSPDAVKSGEVPSPQPRADS